MRSLVWALPALLGLVGCKPKPSEEPDERPSPSSSSRHGEQVFGRTGTILPIEVCEHLARMVASEAGVSDPQLDPQMMSDCETELFLEAGVRGTDNWNALAGCVIESRNEADLDACDQAHPLPGGNGPITPNPIDPGPPSDDAREREVCTHIVELILRDSAAELGEVPQLRPEDLRGLSDECVRSLVQDQRPALRPEDYAELLDCIEFAQSSEDMQRCE